MAQNDNKKPLTEHEYALLLTVEILIDILLRGGVPLKEFEDQFDREIKNLSDFPISAKLIEGLKGFAKKRAEMLDAELKTKLRYDPPVGSA